ncbi:MAG: hypothetical protein FWD01_02460 [Defluviitaleaceae bacterium]|nr:hypothetical protein [Defluviitaleaceae bacterium]
MRKGFYYIFGGIFIFLAGLIFLNIANSSASLANRIVPKENMIVDANIGNEITEQMEVFLPKYGVNDEESVYIFQSIFGMNEIPFDTFDEFFEFVDDNGALRVYRYLDFIEYFNFKEGAAKNTENEMLTTAAAQGLATQMLQNYFPNFRYMDIEIKEHQNGFDIAFFPPLYDLPNLGFPTEIFLDSFGNLLSLSHYYFDYEPLGSADMIPLAEILNNHGLNFDYLVSYKLVYGFEDSILQPIYQFFGIDDYGQEFMKYIRALRFN